MPNTPAVDPAESTHDGAQETIGHDIPLECRAAWEALARAESAGGVADPNATSARNALCAQLREAGRPDLAAPLYETTLAVRLEIAARARTQALLTRNMLVASFEEAGDIAAAIAAGENAATTDAVNAARLVIDDATVDAYIDAIADPAHRARVRTAVQRRAARRG